MVKHHLKDFFSSPRGAMYLIALLIMAAEFLIMVLIEIVLKPKYGPNVSAFFWEFLDPLLLILDRHSLHLCSGCEAVGKATGIAPATI